MKSAQDVLIRVLQEKFHSYASQRIDPSLIGKLKRCLDDESHSNALMPPNIEEHFMRLVNDQVEDHEIWMLNLLSMVNSFLINERGILNRDIHQALLDEYKLINGGLLGCGQGPGNVERCVVAAYVFYIMQRATLMGVFRGVLQALQRVQNRVDYMSFAKLQEARMACLIGNLKLDPTDQNHLHYWDVRTNRGAFHHGGVLIEYGGSAFRVPSGIARMMAETSRHCSIDGLLSAYDTARLKQPPKSIFTRFVRHQDTKRIYEADDLFNVRLSIF